ncbi:MAG: LPS export ABC transporter permease LptF [Alphaproteobacteria bacterium]|nr:LPS export ABC transporter permease LptF [Alphaproteobacteria bacterium]
MKLLSKYITQQIFFGFCLVSLGMMSLVWLAQSFKMIDLFVTKGLPVLVFLKLTFLALPNFLAIIAPLAFFVVTLFVLNKMNADREITIMKSAGLTPWNLSKPVLFLGIFLTGFGFFLTLKIIPESVTTFRELQFQVKSDLTHVLLQEGQFNYVSKGYTIYVRSRDKDGSLHGIMIYDQTKPDLQTVVFAEKGNFMQHGGKAELLMVNGSRQEIKKTSEKYSTLYFDKYVMDFSELFSSSKKRTLRDNELPLRALLEVKKKQKGIDKEEYRMYKVEAFKRLSSPFYTLVFVLVALVFTLLSRFKRGSQTKQVVLASFTVLFLQSAALGFENLANKNLWFLLLMAANILIPFGVLLMLLLKGKMLDEYSFLKEEKKKEFLKKIQKRFFLFLFLMSLPLCSNASTKEDSLNRKKNQPIEFEANEVIYDKETKEVIASGNVEATQEDSNLKADKIIYNKQTQKVRALGNVSLTQKDGTELFAEEGNFTSDFKTGFLEKISILFPDGSQAWANKAERKDEGNIIYLEDGVFTPCDFCVAASPLWALHSEEVEHNDKEQEFTQKNTFLEIKGYPLIYWPYLQYPDFRVKRKTGFLSPKIKKSQELGVALGLPFYWVLSDHQDLEITPYFSSTHKPLIFSKYRGVFRKGKIDLESSFTQDDANKRLGHLKGEFGYDLNQNWRFKSEVNVTNDDTYFRRYKIDGTNESASWLQNEVRFERFSPKSYFSLTGLAFQNLRADVSDDEMPYVLPVYFAYQGPVLFKGGYFSTEVYSAYIERDNDENSKNISVVQTFTLPYVSDFGGVFNFQTQMRMDEYFVSDSTYDGRVSRFVPTASLEFKYPLIQGGETSSQVIEPVIKLVTAPSSSDKTNIPNNDSLDVEFDDANLFSTSRFTGRDRIEYGTHVAYGMKWALYGKANVSAFLGQSYQFLDKDIFPEESGLRQNFSDYVGRVNVTYQNMFLQYRFRLDYKTFNPRTSEVTFSVGKDPLRFGVDYMFLNKSDTQFSNFPDREEITFFLNSKLLRNWTLSSYYKYGLKEEKGPIEMGGTLAYEDECAVFALDFERSYTKDRDYKGDLSFLLRVNLKMLGGF